MTWHLMYIDGEPEAPQGRVLLDDEAYASWRALPCFATPYGRPLLADGRVGEAISVDGERLAPALRVVPRLPRRVGDAAAWEASLEPRRIDRYWAAYDGLERASVDFFEAELANDARVDALVASLDDSLTRWAVDAEVAMLARQAALFVLAGELVDPRRGEPMDDPAHVPGPLPDTVQDVIRGSEAGPGACEDPDARAAAALLALARADSDDEPISLWARRAVEGLLRDTVEAAV